MMRDESAAVGVPHERRIVEKRSGERADERIYFLVHFFQRVPVWNFPDVIFPSKWAVPVLAGSTHGGGRGGGQNSRTYTSKIDGSFTNISK